ncbi:hypothetical protein GCM10009793_04040 [Brachybacterium phenoliresistens]
MRMYREKTSEGTPNPATWPMWRGPLAYGQATADRTVLMVDQSTDSRRGLAHGSGRAAEENRMHPGAAAG